MLGTQEIKTERLVLRRWRDDDRAAFAALNADLRVAEFLPSPLTRDESDAIVDRIEAHWQAEGFGLWAAELTQQAPFIGFIGLSTPRFEAHFTPCVEVGWRLSAEYWGKGLATEGARAALSYGFEQLGLNEIVSFTVPDNLRSIRVMQKLGMHRAAADDFAHPRLPHDHPLSRHVLYRATRPPR